MNVAAMQIRQHDFISEYNRNSPRTVGLNDLSIIALAQTLGLPVVSMEKSTSVNSIGKRRIPDVCVVENVAHLSFSEFLRDAGIKL